MGERIDTAPCGYISLDRNGHIKEINKTLLKWMGYELDDVAGKHLEMLLSPANRLVLHSYAIPEINLYGQIEELFINMKSKNGEAIPFLLNARKLDIGGETVIDCIMLQMKKRIEYEMELREVKREMEAAYIEKEAAFAELERVNEEIEAKQEELIAINAGLVELSKTDKLTGVPNRRYLEERLYEEIEKFQRTKVPFSVLMIDIDHFKVVNDTHGHQVGDKVLAKLAHILKREMKRGDFTARYGGEEFIMILPGANALMAMDFARSLNKAILEAKWGIVGKLTISIGVAEFTKEDNDESIIEHADQALYESKENGRNQSSLYIK
ncbi:sensor domain-containing diguanylate cyclase [Aciduricibacillus chroicocephali]|uniref:Sensor domain-containing diguanylate cyclase n=1 Tax=Aciduricibacillus chroicocephali TaxID=3054939 RepID=A0ABY9KXY4_9BACI|nr:sensor domain-containing diguanylate cyclase [Bacillaceae bacterium 44XB]